MILILFYQLYPARGKVTDGGVRGVWFKCLARFLLIDQKQASTLSRVVRDGGD